MPSWVDFIWNSNYRQMATPTLECHWNPELRRHYQYWIIHSLALCKGNGFFIRRRLRYHFGFILRKGNPGLWRGFTQNFHTLFGGKHIYHLILTPKYMVRSSVFS